MPRGAAGGSGGAVSPRAGQSTPASPASADAFVSESQFNRGVICADACDVLEDFYTTPSTVEETVPVSEGESVFVLDRNEDNPEWWRVAVRWEQGYVPASFLAVRGQRRMPDQGMQPEPEPEHEPPAAPGGQHRAASRPRWSCCGARGRGGDSTASDARCRQLESTVAAQAAALREMETNSARRDAALRSLARDLAAAQEADGAARQEQAAAGGLLGELALAPNQALLLEHISRSVDGRDGGGAVSGWSTERVLKALTQVRFCTPPRHSSLFSLYHTPLHYRYHFMVSHFLQADARCWVT